jgi:hypothetical protein
MTGNGIPVLGQHGGCWCGLPWGHLWPGKDKGAPHPRNRQAGPAISQREPARLSGSRHRAGVTERIPQ